MTNVPAKLRQRRLFNQVALLSCAILALTALRAYAAESAAKPAGPEGPAQIVPALAGERDTDNNCCPIEHMRVMGTAARANALPFELVVYPQAGHGFNLSGGSYRGDDAADAWRRTRQARPTSAASGMTGPARHVRCRAA